MYLSTRFYIKRHKTIRFLGSNSLQETPFGDASVRNRYHLFTNAAKRISTFLQHNSQPYEDAQFAYIQFF